MQNKNLLSVLVVGLAVAVNLLLLSHEVVASFVIDLLPIRFDFLVLKVGVGLVLHVGAGNVESEEEHEVKVDPAGELEVALSELSEGLGLVGVASEEEGETANDQIGTDEDGSVSLHLIFLFEHEVGACS